MDLTGFHTVTTAIEYLPNGCHLDPAQRERDVSKYWSNNFIATYFR